MSTRTKSINILFFFSLLLPQGIVLLMGPYKDISLALIELCAELTLLSQLVAFPIKQQPRLSRGHGYMLLSLCCLLIADCIYNAHVLRWIGEQFTLLGDFCFSGFMLFLLFFIIYQLRIPHRPWHEWVLPFIVLFVSQMWLVYLFLLEPYYLTDESFAWKANTTFYFAVSSAIFSIILPCSNRINDRISFWFLNAILLLLTANYAIFYQDAFVSDTHFSWSESIWCTTLIAFVWFAYFSFERHALFIPRDIRFSPIMSIRSLLPLAIFGANSILLVCILFLKQSFIANAVDVSNLLLFLILFWTIANEFSIWLANDLAGILNNMFKGNELISSSGQVEFKLEQIKTQNAFYEISNILASYNRLADKTNDMVEHVIETNKSTAMARIASQVSHDIQSPLAALSMMLELTQTLPEDTRLLMRSSVNRIRDIANNLVESKSRLQDGERHVFLLSSIIDALISEKRMQFRSMMDITIEEKLGASSYGIFAYIHLNEFKRVLSNIVNNAVESIPHQGHVTVALTQGAGHAIITITDNGMGIPADVLPTLMQRGVSYAKTQGSGLGLYHAKSTLSAWGGSMTLHSVQHHGTCVTLTLPLASPPTWFVQKLMITPGMRIVVLDDDMSIHQIWQGRFQPFITEACLTLISLSTPAQFRAWMQSQQLHDTLFLIDFELLHFDETGLDLIEAFHLHQQSMLVTSRFEEIAIIAHCERCNIRLLPKGMAPYIPMSMR